MAEAGDEDAAVGDVQVDAVDRLEAVEVLPQPRVAMAFIGTPWWAVRGCGVGDSSLVFR
jgi:hypothetical protein